MTTATRPAKLPPISEAEWQRQVVELALMFGWDWGHWRPAQTGKGWRTPVSGTLGAGFPDLVLVHAARGRLIFAELKRDGAKTTPDQDRVLEVLRVAAAGWRWDVVVWRPADFETVAEALR